MRRRIALPAFICFLGEGDDDFDKMIAVTNFVEVIKPELAR